MKSSVILLLVSFFCSLAYADAIIDAQNLVSLYKGSLQVDARNPAATFFETMIPNQVVTLRLVAKAENTSFLTELSAPLTTRFHDLDALRALDSAQIAPTNFNNFQVWIDGCNISAQIVSLCNASNCWKNSPTTPHAVPTGTSASLGSDFSMSVPVSLNSLDPTQCGPETFTGFTNDKKYIVEFREVPLDVCPTTPSGGRVDFEISVVNQSSTRKKGI